MFIFRSLIAGLLFVLPMAIFSAEENFILLNGTTKESVVELGPHVDERVTPCSTFKVALCLMGFDAGILQDAHHPVWLYQDGFDDWLEIWQEPQTPQSWIKHSCFWYSKVLATCLGPEQFQYYLTALDYGNQDASGGLTQAWVLSSLKISVREQALFLQKLLQNAHPLSERAMQQTRQLLFLEEMPNGWKLFGKTGWSGSKLKFDGQNEVGWFVGWVEKDGECFPFAYHKRDGRLELLQRIPRVKQLLTEALF